MKSVFVQGVLNALETAGFKADAYAGASGSALPAMSAAMGRCNHVGVHYWQQVLSVRKQGFDMGETMLKVIAEWGGEPMNDNFFQPGTARVLIPASAVITEEAAAQTQSEGAKRLGRKLLIDIGRKDRTWIDQHLQFQLFDTHSPDETLKITRQNINDIVYASLRMLHTSKIPATINGKPYIDTSYTCVCPAMEMVEQGFSHVIAISTEPGQLYRDMLQLQPIPTIYQGVPVDIIQPEFDLATLGVDFTDSTDEGLLAVFQYGETRGRHFLKEFSV